MAGCHKGNFSKQAAAGAAGTLRYAIATNPTTLDPGLVADVDTSDLLQNVYEGLVAYGEDNKLHPRLAANWNVTNGGRTYVFHLRKNVKFHDGHEMHAADFKWTFERNCGHDFTSSTAKNYLADIVGVNDCLDGKTTTISGIEAPDDYTLRITLDKPRPYFLGKLTYPCAFVLEKGVAPAKEIASVAESVGTGPFKLDRIVSNQEVDLAANPDYYGGAPKIQRIQRPVIQDAATRLNKFKNGELDLLTLERQDIPAVEGDPRLKAQLRTLPRPAIYYLGINQTQYPPFKDVRVRRAFAMAFDRAKFATDVIHLPEAKGLIPPGIVGYRPHLAGIPFDPAQAKELLKQAGYPDGKGLPPLQLAYRDGRPDSELLAVSAITDLQQNLNVKIDGHKMEFRSLLDARAKKQLAFIGLSWYADYLDPENFLSLLLMTDSGENRDGYSNPDFDRLCAQADTSLNDAQRIALYQKAEDVALADVARIPVYFGQDMMLVSPRVKGLRTNLFGQMPNTIVGVD